MSQDLELPRPQPRPGVPASTSIYKRVIAHDDYHYTVTQRADLPTMSSASPIPSAPPPAPRPRPLQLKPPNPSHVLLVRANMRLGAADPADARDLYTMVLTDTCPGHPVALLNRALAHIALGHPELAAMDAYRAAELIVELQAREARENARYRIVSERRRQVRRRGSGSGLLLRGPRPPSPLRELSVGEDRSEPVMLPDDVRPGDAWDRWAQGAEESLDVLEREQAHLRTEAQEDPGLALIDRELFSYQAGEERAVLRGEAFTCEPACYVGKEAWLRRGLAAVVMTPDPAADAERERSFKFRLEMRAIYRLAGALRMCGVGAIHDAMGLIDDLLKRERVRDKKDLRQRWPHEYAQFVALGDALVQDALYLADGQGVGNREFAENLRQTKISVVGRVIYPWTSEAGGIDSYDTFREMMSLVDAVAQKCMPRLMRETAEAPRQCMLVAAEDIMEGEQLLAEDSLFQVSTKATHNGKPLCDACGTVLNVSAEAQKLLPRCYSCDAVFCSSYCHEASLEYHDPPCGRHIENDIRDWFIAHPNKKAANEALGKVSLRLHHKAWLLCVLMLVRILSFAAVQRKRALDLPAIKLLNGGLKAARYDKPLSLRSKELPWTFKTHVILPIWIQKEMGIATYAELNSFDGWVINNLYAKIGASMNIHKGLKGQAFFSESGKMTREEVLQEGDDDEDVWVGSIYPSLALIDTAMENRGEKPNMVLTGGKMVECIAVDNSDDSNKENGHEAGAAGLANDGKRDDEAEMRDTPTPKVVIPSGEKILRASKREAWAKDIDEDESSGRSSRTTQILVTPSSPPDIQMKDADDDDDGSTATDEMNGLGITKDDAAPAG